jgi:hypothetical protein
MHITDIRHVEEAPFVRQSETSYVDHVYFGVPSILYVIIMSFPF